MSIQSQLVINKFNLPYEMLDIVKSFCFYDKKTNNIIQNSKMQKDKMIHTIKRAITRANNFDNMTVYSDDDEHWAFGYCSHDIIEKLQLQANNCYYCGNYIHYNYREIYYHSEIIHCYCIQDTNHYYETDYDESD